MLTHPPCHCTEEEEEEEEEGGSGSSCWDLDSSKVRPTVSLRRSCSGRSRTWAASCAAGPSDTTPLPCPRCWRCRGGGRRTSTSGWDTQERTSSSESHTELHIYLQWWQVVAKNNMGVAPIRYLMMGLLDLEKVISLTGFKSQVLHNLKHQCGLEVGIY